MGVHKLGNNSDKVLKYTNSYKVLKSKEFCEDFCNEILKPYKLFCDLSDSILGFSIIVLYMDQLAKGL